MESTSSKQTLQDFKIFKISRFQLKRTLWTYKTSRNSGLMWVSNRYPIFHKVTWKLSRLSVFAGPCITHWGRVTHICIGKLSIIGSDNGLSPGRRQAIIWTNAGILLIGPLGTNFSEISIGIQTFSFKKMHLKMSSAKWRPFCLGLNVIIMFDKTLVILIFQGINGWLIVMCHLVSVF